MQLSHIQREDSNLTNEELLVDKIINEGISVRQLEELTQKPQIVKTNPQKRTKVENEYHYLEEELSEKLGTKVVIKKNKIIINFVNANDLNRLLDYMNIEVDK